MKSRFIKLSSTTTVAREAMPYCQEIKLFYLQLYLFISSQVYNITCHVQKLKFFFPIHPMKILVATDVKPKDGESPTHTELFRCHSWR